MGNSHKRSDQFYAQSFNSNMYSQYPNTISAPNITSLQNNSPQQMQPQMSQILIPTNNYMTPNTNSGTPIQVTNSQPIEQFQMKDPSLIISPYLYLGGVTCNQNPSLISYLGITHVLNMAVEIAPNFELLNGVRYKHIPADDTTRYNMRYHFEEAFQFIDDARNSGGKVLVHCMMGISRSATIVIGYLMSRYNMSLSSAYNLVKNKRPEINPNPAFRKILERYEQEIQTSQAQYQPVVLRQSSRKPNFDLDRSSSFIYPSQQVRHYRANNTNSIYVNNIDDFYSY